MQTAQVFERLQTLWRPRRRRIDATDCADFETMPRLDRVPRHRHETVLEQARAAGLEIVPLTISERDFAGYRRRVHDYAPFPAYRAEFGPPAQPPGTLERKLLEHYLSFQVTRVSPGARVMDVAASNSPVQAVLRSFGVREVYKQDLRFQTRPAERILGGNAALIPVPDASFDTLLLHNSWEHFEGRSDRGFLVEAQRILAPGGRLCIVPLFVRSRPFSMTSPDFWRDRCAETGERPPRFDRRIPLVCDENVRQRLAKHPSIATLCEDLAAAPRLRPILYHLENGVRFGTHPFMLVVERMPDLATSSPPEPI